MSAKLKSLSLENFRVFAQKTDFEFFGINVITGPNNSGKSSLIKAILLLQDNYINEWSRLDFDKGNHNLISFKHTVNNQANLDYFRINLTLDDSNSSNPNPEDILGTELLFKNVDNAVLLAEAKFFNSAGHIVTTAHLIGPNEDIFQYYLPPNWFLPDCSLSEDQIHELAEKSLYFSRILSPITTPHSLSNVISRYTHFINDLLNNRKKLFTEVFKHNEISEVINLNLAKFTVEEVINTELIENLHFKPAIYDFFRAHNLKYEPAVRNQQLSLYPFNHSFSSALNKLMSVKSFYDNNSEEIQFVNKWIGKEGFNVMKEIDGIKIEKIPGAGFLFSFLRNGQTLDLTNLGSGSAQIIPIIIQIIISTESTIMIEEPETNLHPNFQSKLAELFVEANNIFRHQFIIETHSEYLIRKLQHIVAKKELNNDHLKIYYFNNPDTATENQIISIEVFDNGGLSQNFGEGFFDEASRLRFNLLEINNSQKN